jgi:hypothetical protein
VKSGSDVVVDISAAWDIPAAAPFTLKYGSGALIGHRAK